MARLPRRYDVGVPGVANAFLISLRTSRDEEVRGKTHFVLRIFNFLSLNAETAEDDDIWALFCCSSQFFGFQVFYYLWIEPRKF